MGKKYDGIVCNPPYFKFHDYDYLLNSHTLKHIFIIDFKKNVFEDALTTASLLFIEKSEVHTDIQFSTLRSISELEIIKKYIEGYPLHAGDFSYPINTLNPNVKWRKYYQFQNASRYEYLIPFSNYAKVMRGIATGANDYFVFNKEKANTFSIPDANLLPCICKPKSVKKADIRYFSALQRKRRRELN